MTPRDVLKCWWDEQSKDIPACFEYLDSGQIACKITGILWLGLPRDPNGTGYANDTTRFDYALRENGPVHNVLLGDPELFSKISQILKNHEHEH